MSHHNSRKTSWLVNTMFVTTLIAVWSVLGMVNARPARGAQDIAFVTVSSPREASLLQLHGLSGRGTVLMRVRDRCSKMNIRFVAGDFQGKRIGTKQADPVRLRISNPIIVRALYAGHDFVSDAATVGTDPAADITILSGISAKTGFVINPGRNVLADIIGAGRKSVSCDLIEQADPMAR